MVSDRMNRTITIVDRTAAQSHLLAKLSNCRAHILMTNTSVWWLIATSTQITLFWFIKRIAAGPHGYLIEQQIEAFYSWTTEIVTFWMQLSRNQHKQVGIVQEPHLPGGQAEDPISKLKMHGCHACLQSYMQVRLAAEVIFVTPVTADGSATFLPDWCKFYKKTTYSIA